MSVRSNLLVHVRQTKSNQKTQDTHAYHYRRRHLETKFIGIGTSLANADFSTSIPLLCWNNYSAWLFTCSLPFSSCDLSFDVLTCLHINDINNIINDIYWVGQIVSHLLRSQELAWIPLEWNHDSHLLRRRTIGDNFVLRSEAIGLICTANRRLRSSLIFIGGQLLNCRTIELELIPGVKLSSILIVQSESTLQMTPQRPPVFTAFENDSSLMAARDFSNEVHVALYRNFKFICFIALSGAFWILFEVERKQISGSTSAVFLFEVLNTSFIIEYEGYRGWWLFM